MDSSSGGTIDVNRLPSLPMTRPDEVNGGKYGPENGFQIFGETKEKEAKNIVVGIPVSVASVDIVIVTVTATLVRVKYGPWLLLLLLLLLLLQQMPPITYERVAKQKVSQICRTPRRPADDPLAALWRKLSEAAGSSTCRRRWFFHLHGHTPTAIC
uniref:Uncharacterized protein n=1 Tax=Anopheles atroparvus TaxID=41427 RepID=A0A182IQI9_ANOAO